jgi:hypothetical protein
MAPKPPALKKKSGRSKRQTAVEDAPLETLPDWALQELFVFGTGPLEDQWLTRDQVAARTRAQKHMRSVGSTSSFGPLDYTQTAKQLPHPRYPAVVGTLCVLAPASAWSPRAPWREPDKD